MPNEDDRFGDVAEQLKQTEDSTAAASDDETAEETDRTSEDDGTTEGADTATEGSAREEGREQSTDEPAFAFDETEMHGFYVRRETWDRVTRTRSSVTAACSTFDVPEFEGREFQDACLRVMAEHADEIALQILRERGIEADGDRIREVVEMLDTRAEDER